MKFIIDFLKDTPESAIQEYLLTHNCSVIKTYSAFDGVYIVECDSTPGTADIVERIMLDDESTQIDLLSTMTWSTADQEDWWKVYSALKPDLNAETISYERKTVNAIVYMVDSGIDTTHPEFTGCRVENLFSFNGDFADYNGHGTALASVVVGQQCGIVDAIMKSVKIFQSGVPTLLSGMLSALDAIYVDGQNNPQSIKIVNLSWAIPKNEYVESKIQQLIDANFIVVVAAGNNGSPIENVTPASMPDAITVGAYNSNFLPCDFSNYTGYLQTTTGSVNYGALDVWAPGQDIRVAHIGGGLSFTAGTSIATAIQTAALAFNSFVFRLEDASIITAYQNKDALLSTAAGKLGRLTLTDSYQNSINLSTRIYTEKYGENGFYERVKSSMTIPIEMGKNLEGLLIFSSLKIKSYDASNLPTGLYLDAGFLRGHINLDTGQVLHVQVPVVYHDDTTDTVTLKLACYDPTIEISNIADQELVIALTNTCGTSIPNCDGTCGQIGQFCFDCGEPKVFVQCLCIGNGAVCPGSG